MKWYNKDKTMMVDISSVTYYKFKTVSNTLDLIVSGQFLYLDGQDALNLFNMIKENVSDKQLLNEQTI